MILQGLLVLAVLGWLWRRGYLGALAATRLLLFGGAGLVLVLLARRQFVAAACIGVLLVLLALRGKLRRRAAKADGAELEARLLLGVRPHASREEVLAAHRRRIVEVHPDRDAGGNADMASKVNAARDLLLSRLTPGS